MGLSYAGVSSMVRNLPSKQTRKHGEFDPRHPLQMPAWRSSVAQFLGKEEVVGSNPTVGTK